MDARDFIRGSRPWPQFHTYATYVGNIDGSALWAAQLNDERFLPDFRKALAEARKAARKANAKPARPSLQGYTREVDGMFRVATELRMLRAEIGKWGSAPPILGPEFPHERIEAEEAQHEKVELADVVELGKRNWREAKDRAGI